MRYYVGDPHFGHENIMNFAHRPFGSVEEHDEAMLAGINGTVGRRDRLIIVGDFCWKNPGLYRSRIKCPHVTLIRGNHDRRSYEQFFNEVHDYKVYRLTGVKDFNGRTASLFVNHYPQAYWPASHYGSLHVYGHMHDAREGTLDNLFPGRRSMDVGFDTAKRLLGEYRPFGESELVDMLMSRRGHDELDFYRARDEGLGLGLGLGLGIGF